MNDSSSPVVIFTLSGATWEIQVTYMKKAIWIEQLKTCEKMYMLYIPHPSLLFDRLHGRAEHNTNYLKRSMKTKKNKANKKMNSSFLYWCCLTLWRWNTLHLIQCSWYHFSIIWSVRGTVSIIQHATTSTTLPYWARGILFMKKHCSVYLLMI